MRFHLHNSSPEEAKMFTMALEEVLGPLDAPRYVISRSALFLTDTFLSKLLPEVIAKFLRKTTAGVQMYHKVPSCMATTKERAEVFQKHWNFHIGPSNITYGRSAAGKQFVESIQARGMGPQSQLHRKQVFL